MPILAVNEYGQIYQTDPDREDGLGFGYAPECVDQGDLTLGSAYLKSQGVRQQELLQLRRDQRMLDREDAIIRARAQAQKKLEMEKEMAQHRMMENPRMQEAVLRKALSMGCPCEYSTPLDGNVFSANGMNGRNGMSRDQRVIHDVAFGRAHGAYKVDPVEARQHEERIRAQRLLRLNARR